MSPSVSRILLWIAPALLALSLQVRAEGLNALDQQDVRAVVQAQLDAFAADDARRAFSFAAPELQKTFGSPERFMAMVRSSYPMVHRHAAVAFLVPQAQETDVIQRVHLTDSQGDTWLATYLLQRQKDKSWRISACVVTESRSRST